MLYLLRVRHFFINYIILIGIGRWRACIIQNPYAALIGWIKIAALNSIYSVFCVFCISCRKSSRLPPRFRCKMQISCIFAICIEISISSRTIVVSAVIERSICCNIVISPVVSIVVFRVLTSYLGRVIFSRVFNRLRLLNLLKYMDVADLKTSCSLSLNSYLSCLFGVVPTSNTIRVYLKRVSAFHCLLFQIVIRTYQYRY